MQIILGDSVSILSDMEENSIDSIVTDPPYGISFMGKDWDKALPPIEIWEQCIRVLKPGGYLIAMSASRTFHRLAVQLEDLGLIVHPMIGWIYGSGFPKATDLSKQFDKGVERECLGDHPTINRYGKRWAKNGKEMPYIEERPKLTTPTTDLAKQWNGYKYGLQSLKPALEPIGVFQKPWKTKDVKRMTDNIEKWGVGAINIDGCRVEPSAITPSGCTKMGGVFGNGKEVINKPSDTQGRHPANLLHDGSESVEAMFLEQGGDRPGFKTGGNRTGGFNIEYVGGDSKETNLKTQKFGDSSSASRFFNSLPITDLDAPFLYCAKASKKERNEGLEGFEKQVRNTTTGATRPNKPARLGANPHAETVPTQNHHPTVKPIALMSWLVRLVTPPDGTCLDPFVGSGTTGIACEREGFEFIGIEREPEFHKIAEARITANSLTQDIDSV